MKLKQLQEARYYREKDKYVCPKCKGSGESSTVFQSPITQNRMRKGCKYCDGRGYLKQRDIDQKRNPPKLKLMREARYVSFMPETRKRSLDDL